MKFPVLSDEELAAQRGTLKPGICDFEVIAAEDQISKTSGNPMVKLTLRVWDSEGRQGQVFDYMVSTAQWKIKSFFESIGNPDAYGSGEIDVEAIVGAAGKAKLSIEKDPKYGDKPKIGEYVLPGVKKEVKPESILAGEDDIPF